jgi:lipopolysaccharide/colanic/teichoic acid biosynthesis glycosyltransferase
MLDRSLAVDGTIFCTAEFVGWSHQSHPGVEGSQLAEIEMIDDRVVTPAGVGTYLPPERLVARHVSTAAALTPAQSRAKRCLDVFGAITGLVILAPVLVLLAVLVALDSPGPILFAQTRVGFRGRTFRMLKFRTMRDGADGEKAAVANLNQGDDTRLFKILADPRVTRLGRVLRRWSLDELPQLFNILNGEMSIVGPRPFFESDLDDYEAHHFRRLSVPPGLTGLWQVSGRSDIVEFEEVVRLDRYYIEHWSMGLDLRILARTLPTVISRRGAY